MKNNNILWSIVIIIILIVGGYFLLKNKTMPVDGMPKKEMSDDQKPAMNMQPQTPPAVTTEQTLQLNLGLQVHTPKTLTFDVNGGNFYFTPNQIHVKVGDTVKINFKNDGGFHDFKIDEFDVATNRINSGETTSVTFVANKKGTFEYYCSVGSHRANGMKGNLIVE